ncbi:MAG: TetR/AcrR family transcriptional regulator [Candidatus Omnitrophica bacterium]|nr:TetR/AcrR family transcriptional regulator [Candidatus Omnitrophota bacterium]MDD5737033.1 TetR/AcrR family transcriptional regulator [Candidatus Omnitrophota bacterium]
MKIEECSLREKKHAKMKIAIMNAFMGKLAHNRFDDISIRELCRDVEVAEGTFFNYFPEKIDVVRYFINLTSSKMIWKAKREVKDGKYLHLIDAVFCQMSKEWSNSNLAYQIISALLVQVERPKKMAISALERGLAFPDCAGIEETPPVSLGEWFKECVVSAQKNGELPSKTDVDDVIVSLATIMCGTLLVTRFSNSDSLGYHYMRQLKALWRGLGVAEFQSKQN